MYVCMLPHNCVSFSSVFCTLTPYFAIVPAHVVHLFFHLASLMCNLLSNFIQQQMQQSWINQSKYSNMDFCIKLYIFFLYFSPVLCIFHQVFFCIFPFVPSSLCPPQPPPLPHTYCSFLSAGCQAQIRCLGKELECCPSPHWMGIQEPVFTLCRWNNRTGQRDNIWDKKERKKIADKKNKWGTMAALPGLSKVASCASSKWRFLYFI